MAAAANELLHGLLDPDEGRRGSGFARCIRASTEGLVCSSEAMTLIIALVVQDRLEFTTKTRRT